MHCDQEGQVYLGATDWRHPVWVGVFYPEAMPEEWRLTYYNTQYTCVWLPYSHWTRTDVQSAKQWREDTHAGFRFVLERPPILDDGDMTVLEALGDRVGKLCLEDDTHLIWFDATTDLKTLASQIQARDKSQPCYLLSREGDLATLDRVSTLLGLLGL